MDRSVLSISNEDAERIKKAVAKEYETLRESLQSRGEKEDNSNFRRNHQAKGQISEAERIKEAASEILATLRETISSSEGRGELSKFSVGAKSVEEVNVNKRLNVDEHFENEGENETSARKERNVCNDVLSFSIKESDSSNAHVDNVVHFSVNNSGQICSISNPENIGGTFVLPRKEEASSSARNLNDLTSDSVLCVSETQISFDNCRKNGGQQQKDSVSTENHSWGNFVAHLVAIKGNNNIFDLLSHDDIIIFNSFTGLCMQAQTAFIHILNNEYTWYRESGLLIPKLSLELKPVIDTLIENQFLITGGENADIDLLLDLLTVQELKNVCRQSGLRDDGRKVVLKKSLIEFAKKQKIMDRVVGQDCKNFIREEIFKILGRVIKLNHTPRELFLRTQLLYAIPLTKTMKVDGRVPLISIMNDVTSGKICHPDYTLEPLPKLFPSRESLVRFQHALHLEANVKWNVKLKEFDEVLHLHESAIIQFQEELRDEHASEWSACLPNCLRTFTRGTVLARAVYHSIECLRVKKMYTKLISAYEMLLSQDLYLKLYKGLWYDQLAAIYLQIMKDVSKTAIFLTEALADPSLSYIDRVLLSDRASPIFNGKKRKRFQIYEELKSMLCILKVVREISIDARCFDAKIEKEKKFSYIYETVEGVGQILSTPEEVIMLHFERCGYSHGVHSSSVIGSSIFGILFWDVIYQAKVPNVFLCSYQSLPLDLSSGEFYANRESQIKTRIAQIKELWSELEMHDHIHKTWSKEEGKKSVVSWKIFQDVDQFEVILRCIGRQMLAKICAKMAKDFHLLQKGFPSMILWNQTTKTCKFIQVKNPNSQLTPSQRSWLLYLNTAGGDAFACCVNAVGSKPPKRKPDSADEAIDLDESMELDCAY